MARGHLFALGSDDSSMSFVPDDGRDEAAGSGRANVLGHVAHMATDAT